MQLVQGSWDAYSASQPLHPVPDPRDSSQRLWLCDEHAKQLQVGAKQLECSGLPQLDPPFLRYLCAAHALMSVGHEMAALLKARVKRWYSKTLLPEVACCAKELQKREQAQIKKDRAEKQQKEAQEQLAELHREALQHALDALKSHDEVANRGLTITLDDEARAKSMKTCPDSKVAGTMKVALPGATQELQAWVFAWFDLQQDHRHVVDCSKFVKKAIQKACSAAKLEKQDYPNVHSLCQHFAVAYADKMSAAREHKVKTKLVGKHGQRMMVLMTFKPARNPEPAANKHAGHGGAVKPAVPECEGRAACTALLEKGCIPTASDSAVCRRCHIFATAIQKCSRTSKVSASSWGNCTTAEWSQVRHDTMA